MKQYIKPSALLLTIVGGINWLTFALFDLNIVSYILGDFPDAQKAIYIIVGLSAIYSTSLFKDICSFCNNDQNNKKNDIYW